MPQHTRRTLLKTIGATAALGAAGTDVAAAVGAPSGGDSGYWTTGEQYGFGTVQDHAESDPSRVWYALTEGALTQVRFPRADLANVRTLDFLVVDSKSGYTARTHEVDRTDTDPVERSVEPSADDALLFEQTARDPDRGWQLTVEYAADPDGDAILADVSFNGRGNRYDVYAILDPACSNSAMGDAAQVVRTDGVHGTTGKGHEQSNGKGHTKNGPRNVLTARDTGANDDDAVILDDEGNPYNVALALDSRTGFEWATVDVVDGDVISSLLETGQVSTTHTQSSGNVALVGRLGSGVSNVTDTLALGFATESDQTRAREQAASALQRSFGYVRSRYAKTWRKYLDALDIPDSVRGDDVLESQYKMAAMVLKGVESKQYPGAGIASPSVPWGEAVQANKPQDYGYNYVWSRDLYQAYTALEAMGDVHSAKAATEYLYTVQQRENGFLPQNTYLDGRTRWGGEQMDNISFPAIMAYQLKRRHGLGFDDVDYDYEHVQRSADYVVANGPETAQERWEEESGLSPSTIAAEISGLTAAASLAADEGERTDALVYLALADHWQRHTEEWMATETGTDAHTNTPYYFRINDDRDPDDGASLSLNNGGPTLDERNVIDAGFLELVRLGVKPADNPVIQNSVEVVDETIRVETPSGPAFYRYNGDGYGEQGQNPDDAYPAGAPWSLDNAGQGRLWPIFSGERAEYELLADGALEPATLLRAMAGFANSGLMIPEQVWDREDPTAYGWAFGEGTGSATPLTWSMAQFIRLAHSLDVDAPVEQPAVTSQRYASGDLPEGPTLDVEFPPAIVSEQTVTVSVSTSGSEVVVKTPVETVHTSVDGAGEFAVEVDVTDGESRITVVASDGGDVTTAGTAVERKSVAYLDLGTEVATWEDPAGDDHGPGEYVYPTADVFVDGAFDFTSFGVYETESTYQFVTRIAGELLNPWGGNGLSIQTLQVYFCDPDASNGTTQARTDVNVTFEKPYQQRLFVEGFISPRVEAADGSVVSTDVTLEAYQTIDAFVVEVPKSVLGDLAGSELVPLLLCQDGYSDGRIRDVKKEVGGWHFGGGRDDDMDPNVIDLVTPDGISNADALAYSAREQATVPYLSIEE
ncbi:glucodextranase DOMON-like domain-containing protein [Halospeciosus flavus]|uniref:Glucodextranase DOMON-like domain-containing protein n=1 Tax=Halospeciosus flavus TaxID=3032283 RepID=A0ABD5Z3A7_9EURY|nr:glucodextranase DOMON-like domain-containing protein [Halospeciosus flavus]